MTVTARHWRALILSIALSALAYLGVSLWSGWGDVHAAVARVGWHGALVMLALSALNYGLRFLRWQLYLGRLGFSIPWAPSLVIYLSGFALTTTPGKAGEAIRGLFLKRYGVGYAQSIGAFVSERLSDLTAVVLLAAVGLSAFPSLAPVVAACAAAVGGLLVLLCHPRWLKTLYEHLRPTQSRAGRAARLLVQSLVNAQDLHRPGLLAASTCLAVAAWGAEAWAFHLMLAWLGLSVDSGFASFTYAISMLAGAVSFMPGGLGGAEASMVALLLWAGAAKAPAVAATVLIRVTTLWFAVFIGLGALFKLLRDSPADREVSASATALP